MMLIVMCFTGYAHGIIGSTSALVITTYYADVDGDGFGDPANFIEASTPPPGYVENNDDCNDLDATVHSGAQEICNGIDDDCDGEVDEGVLLTFYVDYDQDGICGGLITFIACSAPGGWVTGCGGDFDCDDWDPNVGSGPPGECSYLEDCNNDLDDDGDGLVDEDDPDVQGIPWYADEDGDGYGDANTFVIACSVPEGYVPWPNFTDCDDTNSSVNPGATEIPDNGIDDNCDACVINQEVCNDVDDDCDGLIDAADDSCIGLAVWYADQDGDGFGNPEDFYEACAQPSGYVGTGTDCNDLNPAVNPDTPETSDGIDNDCDGLVDENNNTLNVEAGDCEVVFYGYAPEACRTLSVTVVGGTTPFTYSWSNAAITGSVNVCPSSTTIYGITVTDANGYSAEDNVTVQVIDVTCGNNNNKVLVCHIPPGNPENANVICISASAIPDHLAHGCYVGVCDAPDPCEGENPPFTIAPNDNTIETIQSEHHSIENGIERVQIGKLDLKPNPADDHILVELPDFNKTAHLRLFDLTGVVLQESMIVDQTYRLSTGSFVNGIYVLQIISNGQVYIKEFVVSH